MPKIIDPKTVRELVEYNSETGELFWRWRQGLTGRQSGWNTRYAGKKITVVDRKGYIAVQIYKQKYRGHRVAWTCHYGKWPKLGLDHINRVRTDNRIINLREATVAQNGHNVGICKRNSSGHRGVFWHSAARKWQARICVNTKEIYLGLFYDLSDAIAERRKAEQEFYGEFALAS